MTIHCNGMWWPPTRSLGGFLNSIFFMTVSGLTLYNFYLLCIMDQGIYLQTGNLYVFTLNPNTPPFKQFFRPKKPTLITYSGVECVTGTKPRDLIIVANVCNSSQVKNLLSKIV
jgi:hypothetical protein